MRFVKRVNERGTTTLPNEVRAALDIEEGDLVEFEILSVIKKGRPKGTQEPYAATASHDEIDDTHATTGGNA